MRIATVSANGGSGRTTLILDLAVALSRRGIRTLMVDLDPQGSLGFLLGRRDDEWRGLADFLMGRVTLDQAVKRSTLPLLSLLPRGRLDPADAGDFERAVGQPNILRAGLRNLERSFDVLLLDGPPGTGMIPTGALAVADEALVTIRADTLAVRSATRALRMVELVRRYGNPRLRLTGVLPTFVGESRGFEQSLIEELRREGVPVLDFAVPESDLFRRASDLGQPVARLAPPRSAELAPIAALADLYAERLERGDEDPGPFSWPASSLRYEKFSARRFRRKPEIPENGRESGPVLDLERLEFEGAFGSKEWEGFLDACLRASAGETAFATDGQGLVLASRGNLSSHVVSSVGTRLAGTLDQARRMEIGGGEVRCGLTQFEHLWLTGVAVRTEDGEAFTVGVLAPEPIPPRVRDDIGRSLRELLARATVGVLESADDELWDADSF